MNTFLCLKCGHVANQTKETEVNVFCPQCGKSMGRVNVEQKNIQQYISSSHFFD
jgi:predicted RNA-binding Zn-ribbon protein involved in translation (DUF1610 family)